MKPGRNDTCPCGSGKKFKQCCQAKVEDVAREGRKWHALLARFDRELLVHGQAVFGADAQTRAWQDFSGSEDAEAMDPEDPIGDVFLPWSLYNWTGTAKQTIAESYLAAKGAALAEDEKAFLRANNRRPFSFHKIVEVRPGQGFKLLDVLKGTTVDVVEPNASPDVAVGDLIYGAVTLPTGPWPASVIMGPWSLLPEDEAEMGVLRAAILEATGHAQVSDEDLTVFGVEIRALYLYEHPEEEEEPGCAWCGAALPEGDVPTLAVNAEPGSLAECSPGDCVEIWLESQQRSVDGFVPEGDPESDGSLDDLMVYTCSEACFEKVRAAASQDLARSTANGQAGATTLDD